MSNLQRIEDGDKVLLIGTVGTSDSLPEGLKVVFLVHRGRSYLVEEQTAFTFRSRVLDSEQRKRDSQRVYVRAMKTPVLTLEAS